MLNAAMIAILGYATWQTCVMVLVSSLLGVGFGLVVGIMLFVWRHPDLKPRPWCYQCVGFVVNVTRSVPFIILLIGIIPFTRW